MIRSGRSSQQNDPTKDWQSAAGRASLCGLERVFAPPGIPPRRPLRLSRGFGGDGAISAVATDEGFDMKLTDTQRVLLSAASQHEDRAVELPANLKGGAAQKVMAKLLAEGIVEEMRARGSLPVWR